MPSEVTKEIELELAHVLFIDIVGYSKLLIEKQRKLLEILNETVRGTEQFRQAEASGRLLKIPTGDGMALVFYKSPEEPAECALELARADMAHPELQLRMGIHSGPISGVVDVNGRTNVAGAGINMAQRVMDCGDVGHILLSKHVAEDLEQYGHWQPHLHDLGECEVKHDVRLHVVNLYTGELGNPAIPEKFRRAKSRSASGEARRSPSLMFAAVAGLMLFCLAAIALIFAPAILKQNRAREKTAATDGAAISPSPGQVASPLSPVSDKSIAVLPFENLSSDKENAYFADGIQDEILTRLSKIADLKVISRTSTQHYKSAPSNLPEIAQQLGVAHILEGSVQKSGDAVRVNVQLIKAANDSHLWADTFDRKLTDIFLVESDISRAIADQLRAKLTGREKEIIADKPTNNPGAYDAYLRGLAFTLRSSNTPGNAVGAQKYLRDAVRLDPNFALAWALLSTEESRGYLTASLRATPELREEARQAAEKALTLAPNLGEALLAKGYFHYACLKDYDTAMQYYEEARQYLPNNSRIAASMAYVERRRGRWDRSETYFNEAERLDPRNVAVLGQHANSLVVLRRFAEARQKAEQILNITPDDIGIIALEAHIAQAEGDLPRAAALLAPLRPPADEIIVWETQLYQAILERRPSPLIPRVKEILAKPDPALGYNNSELRFWLGWSEEIAGDRAAAQETWRQTRSELQAFLKVEPENNTIIGDLALVCMFLGDRAAAFEMAERAVAAEPVEKDAIYGPGFLDVLARVAAQMGEPDRAIALIEKLLLMPVAGALNDTLPLTPALLRLDPMFDPLRSDPRFQKLAHSSRTTASP